jgi:hypothetical protein
MKNYSKINDPKDLITKEYLESNTAGKKLVGTNAEVFNDYKNSIALGDYSSAHGKSTTNFNNIAAPEAIYYKALPNVNTHPDIEYWDIDLAYEYNYYGADFEVLVRVGEQDVSKLPSVCYLVLSLTFEDPEAEYGYRVVEENIKLSNGQCELDLGYYRNLGVTELYIIGIEDSGGNPLNVWYEPYKKHELPEKYNFEDYLFTTDSADSLGQVDTVYKYVDEWGNLCYTLNPEWHPNAGTPYEINDWVFREEILNTNTSFFVQGGHKYKLVLSDEFMTSSGYETLKSIGINGWTDDWYTGNSYYEDLSGITDTVILDRSMYSTQHPNHYSADFHLYYGNYEGIVGTLYEYISTTPTIPVEDNDPILKTIKYEALINGGQKFSLADGEASTVYGKDAVTNGTGALASGRNSIASSNCSVAIGKDTVSRGPCSFSVGLGGKATGMYSFAANEKGVASGYASMVVGDHCASTNYYSISGGYQSKSSGHSAIAIGYMCEASGMGSVAMGSNIKSRGAGAVSFGKVNEVLGDSSVAIGYGNKANGTNSIALGLSNVMDGIGAGIGEGNTITVNGYALGKNNKVYGYNSVAAIGAANTVTESAFNGAVAVGHNNTISGEGSCAVGVQCKSKALGSVALGWQSEASGRASIAAGISAVASGTDSVAIGRLTKATGNYQVVLGRGNVPLSSVGSSGDAVLIVGIGVRDNERANGLVVYGDGRVELGANPTNTMDAVTKQYLDSQIGAINEALQNIIAQQEAIIAKQNELLQNNA